MNEEKPNKTPIEDLRQRALEHYEDAARLSHHYSSFIRDAILSYTPSQIGRPIIESVGSEVCYQNCGNTQPYNGICLNCGSSLIKDKTQDQDILIEDLMNEFASDWVHRFDEIPDIYSEIRKKFQITRKP